MDEDQIRAMRAIHGDMDPCKAFGGLTGLWVLPADHAFNRAFQAHDIGYDLAYAGILKGPNSDGLDNRLLREMLKIAEDCCDLRLKIDLKIQAYMFYELCQIVGRYRWPEAAKE